MSDERFGLTSEELALLTPFNAAAYDLLRMSDRSKRQPYWLCMSEEARTEAREQVLSYLRGITLNVGLTMKEAEILTERLVSSAKVEEWCRIEGAMKSKRAAGNPGAYFAS